MTTYSTIIGLFVRCYAKFDFEADSDELATRAAIDKFRSDSPDIQFEDMDHNNIAMPSICQIFNEDTNQEILQGHDFALSLADARDLAADDMLAMLRTIARMNYDGEEINDKEFVMENDDAVSTLSTIIQNARDMVEQIDGAVYAPEV